MSQWLGPKFDFEPSTKLVYCNCLYYGAAYAGSGGASQWVEILESTKYTAT